MGINKLFKEFWEILRYFGALAEEFQNLVVRALVDNVENAPDDSEAESSDEEDESRLENLDW